MNRVPIYYRNQKWSILIYETTFYLYYRCPSWSKRKQVCSYTAVQGSSWKMMSGTMTAKSAHWFQAKDDRETMVMVRFRICIPTFQGGRYPSLSFLRPSGRSWRKRPHIYSLVAIKHRAARTFDRLVRVFPMAYNAPPHSREKLAVTKSLEKYAYRNVHKSASVFRVKKRWD